VGDPEPPKSEVDHYIRCPACGGWIDCRDLGLALDHEVRCHTRRKTGRNDKRSIRNPYRRNAAHIPRPKGLRDGGGAAHQGRTHTNPQRELLFLGTPGSKAIC